ncbi:glycosyltransferase family 4 protein [Natronomonas salina]|uniref:glycosyltransferase family 4 protein n=1 Tax=Natronomonas salina TaxID=1710540 RepID=UPI0015B3FAB1|nr:glycosyltransferase family 4 protein [Natronomonas salina]QLD90796.1 glycosyltransferase family 4 protein [Natronomonas salina]
MKLGLYIGTHSDPVSNIAPVLNGWSDILKNTSIEVELYGGASVPKSLESKYNYIKQERRSDQLPHKIIRGYQYTRDYIRDHKPDAVMQVWKYATHAPGVALAGRRCGVPAIGRFTGDTFNEYRGISYPKRIGIFGLNNVSARFPLHLFDKIIALGPYGESQIIKRGVSKTDVVILPPPKPSDNRFNSQYSTSEYRDKLNLPHHKKIFLYVGRMSYHKGLAFLCEAINELSSLDQYMFLLVGTGPYESVINREFDNNHVRALGRVPYEEIDQYYKAADCYLHPSEYEGIPLVILEALACGTPILARSAGDIPFVTSNIIHSPNELASAIANENYTNTWKNKKLFEKPEQRRRLTKMITNTADKY